MTTKTLVSSVITHGMLKFRQSNRTERNLAFGHSLWVHQQGLFFVNTAGVWYRVGGTKILGSQTGALISPWTLAYVMRVASKKSAFKCMLVLCALCLSGCVFICMMVVLGGRKTERVSEISTNWTSDLLAASYWEREREGGDMHVESLFGCLFGNMWSNSNRKELTPSARRLCGITLQMMYRRLFVFTSDINILLSPLKLCKFRQHLL